MRPHDEKICCTKSHANAGSSATARWARSSCSPALTGACGEAGTSRTPNASRHPAALRRGGRGLHHHEHLWRQPPHAPAPRPRGGPARHQPGGGTIAREAFGGRPVSCSATSARSARSSSPTASCRPTMRRPLEEQARALVAPASTRSSSRRRLPRRTRPRDRCRQSRGRAVHHRLAGLRPVDGRDVLQTMMGVRPSMPRGIWRNAARTSSR